jgi:hypothetical protein
MSSGSPPIPSQADEAEPDPPTAADLALVQLVRLLARQAARELLEQQSQAEAEALPPAPAETSS